MKLVIVETSAQAKALSMILGEGWHIEPCYGHVRDFRAGKRAVDTANGFELDFAIAPGKGGLAVRLKKLLRQADVIYAATPPGRSGDLMAWHVLALVPDKTNKPVYRVVLAALTPDTIRAAFAAPRILDMRQIDAELARRIIGQMARFGAGKAVSYTGMIALRLLLEREQEIAAHVPQSWWKPAAHLTVNDIPFTAQILNAKGTRLALRSEAQAEQLERMLAPAAYWVEGLRRGIKTHPAPIGLSIGALVEAADREFAMPPERALSVLTTLYEAGWVTHPQGSPLPDAQASAFAYIERHYGSAYADPDAAEIDGIAPVDITHIPDSTLGDGALLYGLIWRHFVAAHMKPAQEQITAARVRVGPSRDKPYPVELRATSKQMLFDGWMRLFSANQSPTADAWLPHLEDRAALKLARIETQAMTSSAPPRYTEASLALAIEAPGVPLPDAISAVEHIKSGGHIADSGDGLALTDAALTLSAELAETFGDMTDPVYTAELAAGIDRIAAGEITRGELLAAFWSRFGEHLSAAEEG